MGCGGLSCGGLWAVRIAVVGRMLDRRRRGRVYEVLGATSGRGGRVSGRRGVMGDGRGSTGWTRCPCTNGFMPHE